MPPYINHPARVAERIATLDLISDGRVDYGIGAGASETELGGFSVPQDEKKAMMLEGARAVIRMLTRGAVRGLRRQILQDAGAQRGAQAAAETASAAVDGVFQPDLDPAGRAAGSRRADVFLRGPGTGPPMGDGLLHDVRK